jgi:hypothetical protein
VRTLLVAGLLLAGQQARGQEAPSPEAQEAWVIREQGLFEGTFSIFKPSRPFEVFDDS